MGSVTSRDGTTLAVFEEGEGQPLVLLHGLSGTHEIWERQTPAWAKQFRVISYDARGHGDSAPGVEGYGPQFYAEDLAAVLTELDLRNAVVVGHSLGGTAVGQFATHHPEAVREHVAGLVFVGTFASALKGEGWWRENFGGTMARQGARLGAKRKPSTTPSKTAYRMARYGFGPSPRDADVKRMMEIGLRTPPAIVAQCTINNLGYDVHDKLGAVGVPALVIVGDKDRLARLRSARRLSEGIPGAELVVLPGVGHMVMFERADELTALIEKFAAGVAN